MMEQIVCLLSFFLLVHFVCKWHPLARCATKLVMPLFWLIFLLTSLASVLPVESATQGKYGYDSRIYQYVHQQNIPQELIDRNMNSFQNEPSDSNERTVKPLPGTSHLSVRAEAPAPIEDSNKNDVKPDTSSPPPQTSSGQPKQEPNYCSTVKVGRDCNVLVDFETSAIISSGGKISFLEGGCGTPIPSKSDGPFTGIIPCENGEKLIYGDCTFKACEMRYGDPVQTEGSFETIGNKIVFTCRGDGTFIMNAPDIKVNTNYKTLYQYTYFTSEGHTKLSWSCGVGLKEQDFYTPKIALCKKSNMKLVCLNKHLERAALSFAVFLAFTSLSFLELFDPFAWFVTVILVIPMVYLFYRTHKKSIVEVVKEYVEITGKCPLCGNLVSDFKYHLEHCPKNKDHKLTENDLRSWLFFRRLLHWGHKIAFRLEMVVLICLLAFAVSNVDVVGAVNMDAILEAPSSDCAPFSVGSSDAVATFINGRTCQGTTCVGTVDIDSTLRGVSGFTQRFSLGEGLFFDIKIKDVYYINTVNRHYDACESSILQSSTSTCGDGCDKCENKIENYLLKTSSPGTNEWACNGACLHIQKGCTCASCKNIKKGDCYMVGESVKMDLEIILQLQSGGTCKEYDIRMNSKSNKILLTQLSEENKFSDMVAIKDNIVYEGSINRLGEFGGFGDLKFKTDNDLECKDNQKWYQNCHFGHIKTYTYTHCCSDTHNLKDQLRVRANWQDNSYYVVKNIFVGTFRLILSLPEVPIQRNPLDVTLEVKCNIAKGCFSCASGADLTIETKASGPGWFDVTVENANIRPNQLNVNSGDNKADYKIYLGYKTGVAKIKVGRYVCESAYNLDDPGSDSIDVTNKNVENIPGDTCDFFCGIANLFHVPFGFAKFFFIFLVILLILVFFLAAVIVLRRAYRYEQNHIKGNAEHQRNNILTSMAVNETNLSNESDKRFFWNGQSNGLRQRIPVIHEDEIASSSSSDNQRRRKSLDEFFNRNKPSPPSSPKISKDLLQRLSPKALVDLHKFKSTHQYATLTEKEKLEIEHLLSRN